MRRDFAILLLSGNGFRDYLAPIFTGISVPHASPRQLKEFRIGLPSLHEQDAIIAELRSSLTSIDSAMEMARGQIACVREYRARLIADVVTGKLDVREVAANLPDVDPLEGDETFDNDYVADVEPRLDDLEAESLASAEA